MRNNKLTVNEAYIKWQNEHWRVKGNLLENTIRGYISIYNKHLLPVIGDSYIANIDIEKLQNYYNDLRNNDISAKTIKNINQALKNMLNYFQRKKIIKHIQIDTIQLPKDRKKNKFVTNTITKSEYDLVIENIYKSNGHYKYVIPFIAETGIRVSEIAIKISDIDFNKKFIHIKHSTKREYVDYDSHKTKLICSDFLKSEMAYRKIPITPATEKIIKNQLNMLKIKSISSEFLFPNTKGDLADTRNITRYFYDVLKILKLDKRGLSCLRKYYIKKMVMGGMQPKILQHIVGHSDYSTTMKYYLMIDEEDKYKEAMKIYNLLINQ